MIYLSPRGICQIKAATDVVRFRRHGLFYQGLVKGAKTRAAEAIRNQATSARAVAWAWCDSGDHFPKLRCWLKTASAV